MSKSPIRRKKNSVPSFGYSAPALEKGMDIVELLSESDTGLLVSEIATRLKRGMSVLFRVIVVLERRGWIQKDPETSRFRISYRMLQIAHRGTPAQSLTLAASPVMHDLSTRINQSCHLVIRVGSQGLVILRHENQKRHANLSVRLGATIKLTAGTSGHVLLASLGREELDDVLALIPAPWEISRNALRKSLDRIRKRGYELRKSPMTAGVTDISYPIRGFDGRVVAALTVPYLHVLDSSLPTTVEQTRRLLDEAARRISRSLGDMP